MFVIALKCLEIKITVVDLNDTISKLKQIFVYKTPTEALDQKHAIVVLKKWDEFITYNWESLYQNMFKPAFVFGGRNVLNFKKSTTIGFQVRGIGKGNK